jgi:hypothetical protein
MGKLNIAVKKDIDDNFRREVFKRKGLKKGNIKQAVEEAMLLWINTTQNSNKEESKRL